VKDGNFGQNIWESCVILVGMGIILRILAYMVMNQISAPKRPKLKQL